MASERDDLIECSRLIENGLYGDAVDLLSQAVACTPSSELYYLRGQQYENLGQFEKALDDYSSALQLKPDEEKYLESRGVLLSSQLGRVTDSLVDFNRASLISQLSPVPHQHLSLCHLQLGNIDVACSHAERAVALGHSDGFSHYCLGQCRLAAERFHSAVKEFEIALNSQPQNARFWIGLSTAFEGTGNLEKAEWCCQKAIDLQASAMSYIRLARIQLDKANPQSAIENLETAKRFDLGEVEQVLVDSYLEMARQYRASS